MRETTVFSSLFVVCVVVWLLVGCWLTIVKPAFCKLDRLRSRMAQYHTRTKRNYLVSDVFKTAGFAVLHTAKSDFLVREYHPLSCK